jgi:hypothetical protein
MNCKENFGRASSQGEVVQRSWYSNTFTQRRSAAFIGGRTQPLGGLQDALYRKVAHWCRNQADQLHLAPSLGKLNLDEYQRRLLWKTTEDRVVEIPSCNRHLEQWSHGMQSNEDVFKPAASVDRNDKEKQTKQTFALRMIFQVKKWSHKFILFTKERYEGNKWLL